MKVASPSKLSIDLAQMPQRRFPHCSVEEKPRRRGAVPLGVKLYANGFRSEKAAKLAGEKALRELSRWYCQRAEARRRFPAPWSVEEQPACFVLREHNGQALAYVCFEEEPSRRC